METELGTAKIRVSVWVDDEACPMTKMELLQLVNDFHEKLAEKQKVQRTIRNIIGFGK